MKYYHGGAPCLAVGKHIVPRKNHLGWREYPAVNADGSYAEFGEYKVVSLTTDLEISRVHASDRGESTSRAKCLACPVRN